MSIATLSARVHAMTPQDELIGSLTKERIALAVRYAGAQSVEDPGEAHRWLAYALGTEVPNYLFMKVALAYEQRERLEDCDLEFWYEMPSTASNRERLQANADKAIEFEVARLTTRLCTQLGVTA